MPLQKHNRPTMIKKRISIAPYAFIAPALLMLLVFIAYPVLMNLITSFQNYSLIGNRRDFIGLANYKHLLKDARVWDAIRRTFS